MPFSRWAAEAVPSSPVQEEESRLKALRRYQILDTSPELEFDELTRLASELCDAPIALVGLLDEHRNWFKSAQGTGGIRESPREISFCTHAIQGQGVMVVPDTHHDPRFSSNPLVTQAPHLRFYAGAPLRTPEGSALGTLCIMDTRPRQLTAQQQDILEVLSHQVMARIELRHQLRAVELLNTQLKRAMDESHHRIKNNLQVLAALVDIQRLKHPQHVPITELERISLHIRTLGTLHDLLTTQSDPSGEMISLHSSLTKLVPLLRTASGGRAIQLEIHPQIALSTRRTSILLLLISELVGNSGKHGKGTITITLRPLSSGELELTVSDQGPGFPSGFLASSAANTGLELVESMVCWDLKGTIRFENLPTGGGCVIAHIPL